MQYLLLIVALRELQYFGKTKLPKSFSQLALGALSSQSSQSHVNQHATHHHHRALAKRVTLNTPLPRKAFERLFPAFSQ